MMPAVLAVGGIDPTGLAGLAADVRAGAAAGVHVATVVSALTVQNGREVFRIEPVDPDLLAVQIRAVLEDLSIGAVKIGLLPDGGTLDAVMSALGERKVPLVLDPVLSASSGGRLSRLTVTDLARLRKKGNVLLTPNLCEAEGLLGRREIRSAGEMKRAALDLAGKTGCAVLLKGGHLEAGDTVTDVLCDGRIVSLFRSRRAPAEARGTGCALATLIAAELAHGRELGSAVPTARRAISEALEQVAMRDVPERGAPLLPLKSEDGWR